MAYGYKDNKGQILNRLSRAEGQIRGISGMVEGDRYCIDILTQITAVQAALDKVALGLLKDHAAHCMATGTKKDNEQKADELVTAVSRMLAT